MSCYDLVKSDYYSGEGAGKSFLSCLGMIWDMKFIYKKEKRESFNQKKNIVTAVNPFK